MARRSKPAWAEKNRFDIQEARDRFDKKNARAKKALADAAGR